MGSFFMGRDSSHTCIDQHSRSVIEPPSESASVSTSRSLGGQRPRLATRMKKNYPQNWDDIRNVLFNRYNNSCANCGRSSTPVEAHHIVPVSCGGSHKLDNLVPLCPDCHSAVHDDTMAPTVKWYTNGSLSNDEFVEHKRLWKKLREKHGVPRYNGDEDCVYIPLADTDLIINQSDSLNT